MNHKFLIAAKATEEGKMKVIKPLENETKNEIKNTWAIDIIRTLPQYENAAWG